MAANVPNTIDYERLFPARDPGPEHWTAVASVRERVAGGAIPLELTIGLFPGDVRDYEAGLLLIPSEARATAIAAVETAIELPPEQIREAARALACVMVRDTTLAAESLTNAVEPLLRRDDALPPGSRPSEPLVRRRLDLIANLRAGVLPPEMEGARTETMAMYLPPQTVPEIPVEWGRFRDLRPLGEKVEARSCFRALDHETGQEVALQLVRPGYEAWSSEPALLHRARILAGVRHPGLIPILGAEARDGLVGWWCEWVEGAGCVRAADPFQAARMVAEICSAVSAIHATGLPHGEIRAETLVARGASEAPLLMPFFAGGEQTDYAVPEFRTGGKPSKASDIYALGALLGLLTPSGAWPADLEAIVRRATAYLPEARYADVEEMRQALRNFVAATGTKATARRRLWPAVGVCVLLLGGGAAVTRWQGGTEAAYRNAVDRNPNDWRNYDAWARFLVQSHRTAEAREQFGNALRVSPENPVVLSGLGAAQVLDGDISGAVTTLRRASEAAPGEASIWRELGETYTLLGEFDPAAEVLERAARTGPRDYRNWAALAIALQYGSGGQAQAQTARRKALEMAEADARDGKADAESLADRGILEAGTGNPAAARRLLNQAAALRPSSAEVLFRAGLGDEILGDRDLALRLISEAVRRGFPAEVVKRRPELARLRADPRFRMPE